MSDRKDGYCSVHGFDWCKCLEAIENQELIWRIIFNAKHKSKKSKTTRAPTVRSKSARVRRKKNLPDA